MRIQDQVGSELQQLASLIDGMSIAMLTSRDEEGHLLSRPMAPIEMDDQGAIWFFTSRLSNNTVNLQHLNLAFTDEDKATYVSLSGFGELVDNPTRMRALWTSAAKPWFPEGPESPALILLKFVPQTAEYWDAPSSKMVRLLSMAVSVIASRPVGLGKHSTLSNLSHVHSSQEAIDTSSTRLHS